MSKYDPLGRYLVRRGGREIRMTFSEIEKILGFALPPSARKHRPWWSNNAGSSVMTKVWLDAGYASEQVDMAGEQVVFRATRPPTPGMSEPGQATLEQPSAAELLERHGSKSAVMRFLALQGWSTAAIATLLGVRYQFVYNVLRQERPLSPKDEALEAGGSSGPPFFGGLRGTIRLADGVDLTEPADPEWGTR